MRRAPERTHALGLPLGPVILARLSARLALCVGAFVISVLLYPAGGIAQDTAPPPPAAAQGAETSSPTTLPTSPATDASTEPPPDIDSLGLIDDPADGALDPAAWAGVPAPYAMTLMGMIGADILTNRAAGRVLVRTLISAGDAPSGIKQAGDWLAIRLETLNDLGAFSHAAALYKKAASPERDTPLPDRVRRAGMLALIGDNQIATACLDMLADRPEGEAPFWRSLDSLCQSPDQMLELSLATALDATAPFFPGHQGQGGIALPQNTQDVMRLDGVSLGRLVAVRIAPVTDMLVLAEARARLLITDRYFKDRFQKAARAPDQFPEGAWRDLLALYGRFYPRLTDGTLVDPLPIPDPEMVGTLVGLGPALPAMAFYPFAERLEEFDDWDALNSANQFNGLILMEFLGIPLAEPDAKKIINNLKETTEHIDKKQFIAAYSKIFIPSEPTQASHPADTNTPETETAPPSAPTVFWHKTANLLVTRLGAETKDQAYGKNISLTWLNDYVMTWMKKKGLEWRIRPPVPAGFITAQGLETLQNCPSMTCTPDDLASVFAAYRNLGLHNETRQIMTEMMASSFLGQQ